MFYIVHFWAYDPAVGEFLDHMKFDDYEEASRFAIEHDSVVEHPLGLL